MVRLEPFLRQQVEHIIEVLECAGDSVSMELADELRPQVGWITQEQERLCATTPAPFNGVDIDAAHRKDKNIRNAVLEEAAQACEPIISEFMYDDGSIKCRNAILALKSI